MTALRKRILMVLVLFLLLIMKDFIKDDPVNFGGNILFALYYVAVFVFVNWAWDSMDYRKKKSK